MKKQILSICLVLALVASVLTGCSKASGANATTSSTGSASDVSENAESVVIAWLGMYDDDYIDPLTGIVTPGKEKLEQLLSEKSGYNVTIIPIMGGNWIQQTETLVQSGEVDIARYTNQTQIPTWFEDLTPIIEKDDILGNGGMEKVFVDFAQHYIPYRSFEYPDSCGNIYGLPLSMTGEVIVYDSLLFEEWGVEEPEPDTSFEDLLEIGKKMTGINPVTGEQNYGIYMQSGRAEFNAISFNALKSVHMDDGMNIADFDKEIYVEDLKDSMELLKYFQWMEQVVDICPAGISTNAGNEKWLTKENNIAINITTTENRNLFKVYYRMNDAEMTSRFKWMTLPLSNEKMQAFPELQFMGISQKSKVKDAAWDVLKIITTDPQVVDNVLMNHEYNLLPVLKDTSKLEFFKVNPVAQERYDFQCEHGFITDDYWHFRAPIQSIIAEMIAGTITPEDAQKKTYVEIKKWVENKEALSS